MLARLPVKASSLLALLLRVRPTGVPPPSFVCARALQRDSNFRAGRSRSNEQRACSWHLSIPSGLHLLANSTGHQRGYPSTHRSHVHSHRQRRIRHGRHCRRLDEQFHRNRDERRSGLDVNAAAACRRHDLERLLCAAEHYLAALVVLCCAHASAPLRFRTLQTRTRTGKPNRHPTPRQLKPI